MIGIPYVDSVLRLFSRKHVGDGADRLLSFATATLCGMFAILVCTKQYVGSPMTCWAPGEFRGGWDQYARDHCYIKNTYAVDFDINAFPDKEQRENHVQVNYYQWVPLYLFLQAIVFYFPSYIWRKLYKNHGIDVATVMDGSRKLRNLDSAAKEKELDYLSVSILETIREQKARPFYKCFGLIAGNYSRVLTYKYIAVKLMYMVVLVMNFYYVCMFLNQHDSFWAIRGVQSLVTGDEWENSPSFPRVSLCDFKIFDLGNVREFTVQCLLMMNAVNEKVFFIQWFWLCMMLVITVCYNLQFVLSIASVSSRGLSIYRWLNHPNKKEIASGMTQKFAQLIGLDGFLVLYFIESASGQRAASDFATYLFAKLKEDMEKEPLEKEPVYPAIPAYPSAPGAPEIVVGPVPEKEPIV